jgi:integrase
MTRHQRGYIYEAFGAFHVRYYANVDGVRKQLSHRLCTKDRNTGHGSPSAKAVRQLCEDFMRSINGNAGAQPENRPLSVVEFWETIYLPFITSNLKHSTVWGYKQVWQQHLKNHFGTTLLNEYKTFTMSLFITSLARSLKPRTINTVKCLASGIFAHAVASGHCESNPIRDAKVLGKTLENGETKSYTLAEAEQIINALVDHVECQLIMALAFFAGLRKGEIQGLQWEDIEEDCLHVKRAFGRGEVGTPKSRRSVRSVPVIDPLRLLLGLWRGQGTGTGWVFPGPSGEALGLDGVARLRIQPALKRAGVPWKGFHACRRGLGTELRKITGNSNAGMNVLGHSDEKVTQQHYEHAMPEEALRGMRLLEGKVSGSHS